MNETIIVGVTGAPVAHRAVDWAAARAAARGQKIELLGVVGGALGAVGEGGVVKDALEATRSLLDGHLARLAETFPGVEATVRVATGTPVAVLSEASHRAALLVIGSDYRGPHTGSGRGAHGVRIAAGAHSPVVVVPDIDLDAASGIVVGVVKSAARDLPGRIVVGVDGSSASEHAVRFAAAEADRLGEKLIAVSVWTPLEAPRNDLAVYPELYLTNLAAATEEILSLALAGLASDYPDLVVERVVAQGYPSHVINQHAHGARMTVVGTHGRGAIARFLLGSISEEVLSRLATVTAVVR